MEYLNLFPSGRGRYNTWESHWSSSQRCLPPSHVVELVKTTVGDVTELAGSSVDHHECVVVLVMQLDSVSSRSSTGVSLMILPRCLKLQSEVLPSHATANVDTMITGYWIKSWHTDDVDVKCASTLVKSETESSNDVLDEAASVMLGFFAVSDEKRSCVWFRGSNKLIANVLLASVGDGENSLEEVIKIEGTVVLPLFSFPLTLCRWRCWALSRQ